MKSRFDIHRSPDRGFALVATLMMLLLITVLTIGLIGLSSISLRNASRGEAMAEAKANARLALSLAVAQLQKKTGPDRRITASSSILGSGPVHDQWCGVWRTDGDTAPGDRDGDFEGWLVTDHYQTPEAGEARREQKGDQ